MLPRVIAGLLFVLYCGLPSQALAWTRTHLNGAGAHLDLQADGSLRVHMTIGVQVRGGWISRFEIDGLDPGLVLDPDKPPTLVSTDGERKYAPSAEAMSDGRVILRFADRHQAPWRGDYTIYLIYRTPPLTAAGADSERARLSWSMPAWPVGLENVAIELNAPAGTHASAGDAQHAIELSSRGFGTRQVLRWQRVQLPRTLGWSIDFDVPVDALPQSALPGAQPLRHRSEPGSRDLGGPLLAALLMLLALGKLASNRLRDRRLGHRSDPLLPLHSTALRAVLIVGTTTTAGLIHERLTELALLLLACGVALAVDRRIGRLSSHGRPGRPTARDPRVRRALALFGARGWLDGTTAPGLALLASGALVCGLLHLHGEGSALVGQLLLLSAPLFLTSTRLQVPASARTALDLLATARPPLSSLAPVELHVDVDARRRPRQARLSVRGPWTPGLTSVDLVMADSYRFGRYRPQLAWLIVAEADGVADASLLGALPGARRYRKGGRRAHLSPSHAPEPELRALLELLGTSEQSAVANAA